MAQNLSGNTVVNPPSSPLGDINANDLVGLTPENISGALAMKFTQDKITQESVNSQFDNALKSAQTSRLMEPTREKTTAEIENYQYAVRGGYKGTFEDWKNAAETTTIKDYEFAVKGGYKGSYPEWRMELAKMGGTHINIGEKVEEKKAMNKLEGQLYFGKGEHVKELAARKKSEDYQNTMFRLKMQDPVKADSFESEDTVKFIEDRITSMGGKLVENTVFDEDGKTMVWTVKWPSGDTEKIRYKIKD
jgi:hypothetical protein